MRTVIFLGLVCIANAVRSDWHITLGGQSVIIFYAWVLGIAILMDIADFLDSYISKKKET